jgi:hypothetical protein
VRGKGYNKQKGWRGLKFDLVDEKRKNLDFPCVEMKGAETEIFICPSHFLPPLPLEVGAKV